MAGSTLSAPEFDDVGDELGAELVVAGRMAPEGRRGGAHRASGHVYGTPSQPLPVHIS